MSRLLILALALAVGLCGCRHNPKATGTSGITVESIPADTPKFKRIYTAALQGREKIQIKLTFKTYRYSGRRSDGELTQADNKWVLFDPERVADKILDPLLVPLVQQRCSEILELDAAFLKSKPGEFTDEEGTAWRRVEGKP